MRPQNDGERSRQRPVELHIEELMLHGFAGGDRHAISEAVEMELARLLEAGMFLSPAQDVRRREIDAGTFNVKAGAKAQTTGSQISRAVYRSLQQQTRTVAGSPSSGIGAGGRKR